VKLHTDFLDKEPRCTPPLKYKYLRKTT